MNSLKTGIHAKSLVLRTGKTADLEQLIDEYYQRHHPTSPEACLFVEEFIHGEWLRPRPRRGPFSPPPRDVLL